MSNSQDVFLQKNFLNSTYYQGTNINIDTKWKVYIESLMHVIYTAVAGQPQKNYEIHLKEI